MIESSDPVKVSEVEQIAKIYFDKVGRGENSGYKLYERWLDWATRSMDQNGFTITSKQVTEETDKFNASNSNNKQMVPPGNWMELGPKKWTLTSSWSAGLGRVVAIAIEPINQQLMYVGSPGGGLWKSTDAGLTWVPLGDQMNMNILALAINPLNSNTVYVGTSSGQIIKSIDGGLTFTLTSKGISGTAKRILIHPTKTNRMWVSTSSGIFYSTDSGANFSKLSAASTEDLEFKPGNTAVVYACGNSFQLSTDSGLTWNVITSGIVATERMRLEVTSAAPANVYLIQKKGSGFGRIYKSTNSGVDFKIISSIDSGATNYIGSQASRNMTIAVSNTNSNEIHIGGLDYYRSLDGGVSFIKIGSWSYPSGKSYVHADLQVIEYINGKLYYATDGGFYRSTNQGDNTTDLTQNGIGIRQYYRIGGCPSDASLVVGGSQDNGTSLMKGSTHEFIEWLGADGMEAFIDYANPNILYGTSQYGTLYKSTNGGLSRSTLGGLPGDGKGEWETPFEMDPVNHTTVYLGYEKLFRNKNSAASGSWVSLTDSVTLTDDIDELKIAPSDNNYIYFAEGSKLWRTKNGQDSIPLWTQLLGTSGTVNYIAIDPNDPEHVAIATSGSAIYRSANAGNTWTEISGNVPNVTLFCLAFDDLPDNGLYVGTSSGIYYKNDFQPTWSAFSQNLPKVEIRELEIHFGARMIRAGTYGRGIWESPIVDIALSASTPLDNVPTTPSPYPNPTSSILNIPFADLNITSVSIIDALGKPVLSLDHPVNQIDMSGFSKGVYLVRLISPNQKITKRVIVN